MGDIADWLLDIGPRELVGLFVALAGAYMVAGPSRDLDERDRPRRPGTVLPQDAPWFMPFSRRGHPVAVTRAWGGAVFVGGLLLMAGVLPPSS